MGLHTAALEELGQELYGPQWAAVEEVAISDPWDYPSLARLDSSIPGPSISTINQNGSGCYAVSDREVFRPIKYCAAYFPDLADKEWFAREIVEMSCLHVEGLVKRIARRRRLPFGRALREKALRDRVDPPTYGQLTRFSLIHNAAKHSFVQEKDSHLFSVRDAVIAYFISRKLGSLLYPFGLLKTDIAIFSVPQADITATIGADATLFPSGKEQLGQ